VPRQAVTNLFVMTGAVPGPDPRRPPSPGPREIPASGERSHEGRPPGAGEGPATGVGRTPPPAPPPGVPAPAPWYPDVPSPDAPSAAPGTPADAVGPHGVGGAVGDGGGRRAPLFAVPRSTAEGWRWLVIAVVGFLVGQVASAVLLAVVAAATGHAGDVSKLASQAVPPGWVVVSGLVGLWLGFVGAAVVASRTAGTGNVWRDMGLTVRRWDPLVGVAVGLAGQLLLLPVLYVPLEHVVPDLNTKLSQPAKHLTGGFPGADLAVIAVLTVVVVPVVEELFFRGLVLRALVRVLSGSGRALGVVLAVLLDGVVFGLAHFELLQLLGLAAFGVVLAVVATRWRRIGPCIFAHATFNLIAVLSVAYPTGLLGRHL